MDAKEAKREYMRKWRAENKERIALNQQRYWERKAAEMTAKAGKKADAVEKVVMEKGEAQWKSKKS